MGFDQFVDRLSSDETQDLMGVCVGALSLDQVFAVLQAALNKTEMVELGERLVDEGSSA